MKRKKKKKKKNTRYTVVASTTPFSYFIVMYDWSLQLSGCKPQRQCTWPCYRHTRIKISKYGCLSSPQLIEWNNYKLSSKWDSSIPFHVFITFPPGMICCRGSILKQPRPKTQRNTHDDGCRSLFLLLISQVRVQPTAISKFNVFSTFAKKKRKKSVILLSINLKTA